MILNCNNICKSFDRTDILSHCSFHVNDREKVAIIGINGAGKSTLLKIILGEIPADSGSVVFSKDITVGYLAQNANVEGSNTIYDELLCVHSELLELESTLRDYEAKMQTADADSMNTIVERYSSLSHEFEQKGGYLYKSQLIGVLKGLGFEETDFTRTIDTLSGGQKTRVALGKLLLTQPDIIFLDEPTNHLDMESIKWLENYLLNYRGSVVIISHDRYFLDKTVNRVIEIEDGRLMDFSGNYSDFAAKKAIIRNMQMKEYLNQQREIKHQEEVISKLKQFNREKSVKRAESREKLLAKIDRVDKPHEVQDNMRLTLEPQVLSGNDVLSVRDLSKSYEELLFDDVSFEIKRGEKVALIGKNGTGKTTLLKILTELIKADTGTFTLGSNVSIGYYDQEQHVLSDDKTLFEEIQDAYPDMNNTRVRSTLAAFLFTNDDVFKRVGDLSGGEKGRLSLAKLMLSKANFLILDEPTNHLDVTSREILENAINNYSGTVLYVSHDRYFINRTATRILELTKHSIINYDGNYDYYLEKHDTIDSLYSDRAAAGKNVQTQQDNSGSALQTAGAASSSKEQWQKSKEEQARVKKINNQLQAAEAQIEEIETQISSLEEESATPSIASDAGRLMELHKEITALQEKLESLYALWEDLSAQL